jgi:hypothetical protein
MTPGPANPRFPLSPPAAWAAPGRAWEASCCPVGHEVRGLAPDYLRVAPGDALYRCIARTGG